MSIDDFEEDEIAELAVKLHGMLLEYVPENLKTEILCLEAVRQNGLAFKYVPILAAVE